MRSLLAALALCLLSLPAYAQEKKEKSTEPSAAQKKQQERMKSCNERAGLQKLEGDKRKAFMSSCLKGEQKGSASQDRMAACNKEAGAKGIKGDERKKFMSGCLKG
jgi:uncharacterized protein YlxW (UPF0749 family)